MKRPPLSAPSDVQGWFWPVALAVAVVWCSSRSLAEWGPPPTHSDKVVHFLLYGLLATLIARIPGVQRTRPLGIYSAVLITSVFGVTDELHQHFVPSRSMDAWDWVADTSGALLAIGLYAHWRRYREWLETPLNRLFGKRVEIDGTTCVIPGDGFSRRPETDRRPPLAGRAA